MSVHKCNKCGNILTEENHKKYRLNQKNYICNNCFREYLRNRYPKYKNQQKIISKRYKENFIKKYGKEEWNKRNRKICLNYRKKYPEKVKERTINWIKNLTFEVINHYGGKCVCCGENNILFLTIDHIKGNGNLHRKELFGSKKCQGGIPFYRWLKLNNYPEDYQVLCFNCNCGRARNKGVCPHKEVLRW